MANTRQQSGEAPQSGFSGQQGGGRGQNEPTTTQGTATGQARGSGNMPPQRGSLEPAWYGGGGTGPFAMMRRISDEMDRLFESFGMGTGFGRGFGGGFPAEYGSGLRTLWSPHIEVRERDGKLLIEADLPGVRKEDLNVRVEQDAVVIEGERRQESEREEQGYYHSERSYGAFHRVIPLPEGVDADQAKATFRDGVLDIEMPAPQRQRQRGRTLTIEDRTSGGSSTQRGGTGTGGKQQG